MEQDPVIDTSVAHPARVYDYWIGGKDNYAPDRELAMAMIEQVPSIPAMAQANRQFLGRAVRYLVRERGIRQFLDVGSGIPTGRNVHEVAQEIDPAVRVAYVDNDPIVLAHSRALLTSTPEGATVFVPGDARDPRAILEHPAVQATIDRDHPVALMLISVLMYFSDDEARSIVTTLLDALPPGSHLTLSHPTADFNTEGAAQAVAVAARGGITYNTRSRAQVEELFAGLDLLDPGVVPMLQWRPDGPHGDPHGVYFWVGTAVKRAGAVSVAPAAADPAPEERAASTTSAATPLPADIDTTVAHRARVYDYLIGGKDNYAPDRELADAMTRELPQLPMMTRANRDFLGRAVRHLVEECGVRQFLDIGSGIPTGRNVHEVAQESEPSVRVVYVDDDPMVLSHARALIRGRPEGRTVFVQADAGDPLAVLADPDVFATLDRSEPVALMLVSMLMYFDDAVAHTIVDTLLGALPAGSYLVISHPTAEFDPDAGPASAAAGARGGIAYHNRTGAEVERFFAGLELVEPGVVPMLAWHNPIPHPNPEAVFYWVGVARKPEGAGPASDRGTAHPARVYDYMIGGTDNDEHDRALAAAMTEQLPGLPTMLRANRAFLGRAVAHLVAERGVRQFLDIGSGFPTARNVHQVAQEIDPAVRVVYVDNDPLVLDRAEALLTGTPEGRTAFVPGDARDPAAILAHPAVTGTLDLAQPVAVMLVSLLMYFDDDAAHALVDTLLDALPPGSHLVVSHPTGEFDPAAHRGADAGAGGGISYHNRDRVEVERFFAGLELVEPGIVPMLEWPEPGHPEPRSVYYWVGVGVKPHRVSG